MLLAVAEALRANAKADSRANRASDIPVRYGGDEFVLVLPETPKEGARVKGERVRKTIASTLGDVVPLLGFTFTVSIGVAAFPVDAKTQEELVAAADQALYEAKRGGRDRLVVFGDAQ